MAMLAGAMLTGMLLRNHDQSWRAELKRRAGRRSIEVHHGKTGLLEQAPNLGRSVDILAGCADRGLAAAQKRVLRVEPALGGVIVVRDQHEHVARLPEAAVV